MINNNYLGHNLYKSNHSTSFYFCKTCNVKVDYIENAKSNLDYLFFDGNDVMELSISCNEMIIKNIIE